MTLACGIDFGTSNSAVGICDTGGPRLLPIQRGATSVPTALFFSFDYEQNVRAEEIALVADIGGGTSDFSVVRVSPERARSRDRRQDILSFTGVHIGGTDFDRQLSVASVMPELGLRSRLRRKGLHAP